MQEAVYQCDDKDLGAMLQRLFNEGHDEVVVQHPIEGPVVVTRADFKKRLANLERAMKMSPAERLQETKRLRNVKHQKQIRFRTAMATAPAYTVDIDDDENFGKDINGVALDIGGMIFLRVDQYLKGIKLLENEIGCFFDEHDEKRTPIRIMSKAD